MFLIKNAVVQCLYFPSSDLDRTNSRSTSVVDSLCESVAGWLGADPAEEVIGLKAWDCLRRWQARVEEKASGRCRNLMMD